MKATRDWTTSWSINWQAMKRKPKTWNLPAMKNPEWENTWKYSKSPHGMTRSCGNYGTCTAMRNLPSSTARSCRSFRNLFRRYAWKFDENGKAVSALPYDEDEKFWNEDYKETNGNRVPVFEYDYVAAKTFFPEPGYLPLPPARYQTLDISIWTRR